MLVMDIMNIDLRNYLQQNHNKLTWKERIQIVDDITSALDIIHRDLHSGNILYQQNGQRFDISDLGFCGPADKSSKSIYGNLPYIAPEVLIEKEYTFKSDVYGIGMLMWEISSGQPPFVNYQHDYYLAMNIVNGIRPKIVSGTPLKYKILMERCWDADPEKRPDNDTLFYEMQEILRVYYQETLEKNKNIIKKFFKDFNLLKFTQPKIGNNLGTYNLERYYTNSTSKVHHI